MMKSLYGRENKRIKGFLNWFKFVYEEFKFKSTTTTKAVKSIQNWINQVESWGGKRAEHLKIGEILQ